jgi:hypothetical protein
MYNCTYVETGTYITERLHEEFETGGGGGEPAIINGQNIPSTFEEMVPSGRMTALRYLPTCIHGVFQYRGPLFLSTVRKGCRTMKISGQPTMR